MAIGRLKDDFDEGMAPYYLMGATPVALVIGAVAPAPLFPFILALAVYPVFFHFIRQGRLGMALLWTVMWGALNFALVAAAVAQDIPAVRSRAAGMAMIAPAQTPPAEEPARELVVQAAMARGGDFLAVVALSGVSGGALALAAGAVGLNHIAVVSGHAVAMGGGLDAAILAFPPWMVFRAMGLLMVVIGVTYLFVLKLEGREMDWGRSLRWVGVGAFFLVMDTYFYINLGAVWSRFFVEAM
ncbi:MAG: hypothetical protein OEZ55_12165 [Nitrospinota bacterium]|nr:hypothetical protein [Nitrospinota bacterium]MDH5757409.1 hypothetical protein [Nitrospinota bacterium]